MLSTLAQGYGAWNGSATLDSNGNADGLPDLYEATNHKHGVTVKAGRSSKPRIITVEEVSGCIHMPKTYLTRKGALVLYSSESKDKMKKSKVTKAEDVAKVLDRLGNVRRLMASVLFLNDTHAPDPDISVSDEQNQVFMGFLRSLDNVLYKQKMQPGCDLAFYLKALRIHARKLSDLAGAEIVDQIETLLATPSFGSRPSTTATKSSRVLSSAKLTASIKSDTYMGRKILYPALDPTLTDFNGTSTPYSTHSTWPYSKPAGEGHFDAEGTKDDEPLPSNSFSTSRRSSKSASHASEPEVDREADSRRPKSVVGVSRSSSVSHKRSDSRVSAATSGSLVDDPTLYEEVDILLPQETDGPEPDSDLENEYFKAVLNVDELPNNFHAVDAKVNPADASYSDTRRHLTNTPDVSQTFRTLDIAQGPPMTPEITLRGGANNSTFNILDSHVDADPHSNHDSAHHYRSASNSKNVTPRQSSGKTFNSSESANKSEDELSSSNDESFEISVIMDVNKGSAKELKTPEAKIHKEGKSKAESKEKTTTDVTSDSLPQIVKKEDTTPKTEQRQTPSPISRPLSGDSRLSDAARRSSGRKMSAKSTSSSNSESFAMDTEGVAVKRKPVSDVKQVDDQTVELPELKVTMPNAKGTPSNMVDLQHDPIAKSILARFESTIFQQIHGKSSKEDNKIVSDHLTRTKSAAIIHPSTATVLSTGPQLNITQLETEPIPDRPKSEIVYNIPETARTQSTVREVDVEALQRAEKLKIENQKALEALMKDPKEVTEVLASNLVEEFDETGLTAEEMQLAQEILQQKLEEAEKGIARNLGVRPAASSKKDDKKGKEDERKLKRKISKEPVPPTSAADDSKAKRKELLERREQIRQAKKQDHERRVAEKRALQEKILVKAKERQALQEQEDRKLREMREKERYTSAVAEEARQQEEMARQALAESRWQAKEERERRRKEELERRKEEAIRRREEQKRMQDAARQKELEMLEKISDAETVRSLREQEMKRREEEEWKLQVKLMEEERFAQLRAEDEEARIANIEREAEEQAMARLVEERMDAEREQRELEKKRRELQELEDSKRRAVEAEQRKIEEELSLRLEEEEKEREAERQRILELKRLEAEAQERMRLEIEERRRRLMELREQNIEKKKHLEMIKKNQAYTKPWVFSYYVKWPRESYEKLIGGLGKRRLPIPTKKTQPTN